MPDLSQSDHAVAVMTASGWTAECPCCYRQVSPTMALGLARHDDETGEMCPASGCRVEYDYDEEAGRG